MKIHIGISGWTYEDWREAFYPKGLSIKDELTYASRTFNSIEVNGTFYALQKPHTFAKWYAETPPGFVFAIKAPRYITHERRLKDVATPIANFFASGVFELKEKLGPILWQIPPNLPYTKERVENFLRLLPHSFSAAQKIAKNHSEWMETRKSLHVDKDRPILHALEVRHQSFINEEFYELMRQYKVAIVLGDTAGRWPLIETQTYSALTYVRLHGDEAKYPKGYPPKALAEWSNKFAAYAAVQDNIFVFCDNDHKIAAPKNAMKLMELCEIEWTPAGKPNPKTSKSTANDRAVSKSSGKSRAKNKPLNRRRKVA